MVPAFLGIVKKNLFIIYKNSFLVYTKYWRIIWSKNKYFLWFFLGKLESSRNMKSTMIVKLKDEI